MVLVLDTPTLDHIHALSSSFTESPFFAKFRSKRPEDISNHVVRIVFHICGDGILEDERYKAFMSGFGPDVSVSCGLSGLSHCFESEVHFYSMLSHRESMAVIP